MGIDDPWPCDGSHDCDRHSATLPRGSRAANSCIRECRKRAGSAPTGVVSIRSGFRAKAAVQLRTRNRVHRPWRPSLSHLEDGRYPVRTFRPLAERVWPIFACCGWKDARANRPLLDPAAGVHFSRVARARFTVSQPAAADCCRRACQRAIVSMSRCCRATSPSRCTTPAARAAGRRICARQW
jgi:hypothetical protein